MAARIALLLLVLIAVLAVPAISQVQSETPGPLSPVVVGGGSVQRVQIVTETSAQATNSTSFVLLPGASTSIAIPAGERAIITARFSAESACSQTVAGSNWCSVRIFIGAVEAQPASGLDFAFDSTDGGRETAVSWESHAMERSLGPLPAGNYVVRVQWAVTNSGVTFRLDDWSLIVERIQVVP